MSDGPWRLSDQHQVLVHLLNKKPTPQSAEVFQKQIAAYVKGINHE
jgi:hypothetical protein